MTTLYIYNAETKTLVARINGDTNDVCESVAADQYGDMDCYGWTYSPAFGASDGLIDSDDATDYGYPK